MVLISQNTIDTKSICHSKLVSESHNNKTFPLIWEGFSFAQWSLLVTKQSVDLNYFVIPK